MYMARHFDFGNEDGRKESIVRPYVCMIVSNTTQTLNYISKSHGEYYKVSHKGCCVGHSTLMFLWVSSSPTIENIPQRHGQKPAKALVLVVTCTYPHMPVGLPKK